MAEWCDRQKVEKSESTQQIPFGVYIEEIDVNTRDFGMQGFVYKNIFDAGVASAKGSPVGATSASGGGIVTPDFSDVTALAIKGRLGGIVQVAVALNVNAFQWVQCKGLNRVPAKCTGACAAAVGVEWSNDDTFIALSTAQNMFGYSLVAAAGGFIAAGGLYLMGS